MKSTIASPVRTATHKHGLATSPEVGLQQNAKPLVELWGVHLRTKVPTCIHRETSHS